MLGVLSLIVLLLLLLIVVPDRWHARREIAKREALPTVLRGSEARDRTIFRSQR